MNIALSNVVITFEGEPTLFLRSLSTDYQSLSSAYATFQIAEALTIGGDAPDPGQLGNPRFILGSGTQFSITNTHFLPQAEMLDTFVISLGNGQTQWHISGLVVGDRFVYGQGTAILANTAGPTDTELSFPMPDSALIVTKGWDADRVLPMISTGANPLNLTLLQPADFFYGAGSHVLVSPTTFSKMSFNSLYQTQLTIGTTVGISEIVVADTVLYVYLVNISYPIIIDRRAFTGPMRFVHDDLYNGLPLRIGSCERVPENLILELRPHSVLILDPGWTTVRDTIHVTLSGSHATVYYQGEVEPAVFDVVGTEIRFLPWNEPPAADSNSVSSGTVVGIIVAVLLVIPAGTGLYLLFRRRFVAVLADDYDKFTDLPSEQGAVLRDL
jgi:hypothetical protein